jgi:hypothetical protein
MAQAFALPTRSATSPAAPPSTMGASSPSVNSHCSPPKTGDAWIIDREDHLALRLARQGDPEPFHIEETAASFAIDWKGLYRIKGGTFIFPIATPDASLPPSATPPTSSCERKISNMFG